MPTRFILILVFTALLLAGPVPAQVERQHAAQVHGVATGKLALDGAVLRLELEIPGANLIGFEHAPRNDEQQASLDGALALLRAADWLQADPRGNCELASLNAHTHGFRDEHDHHHSGHAHGHEHGHDHHAHAHAHAHAHEHEHSHHHAHDHAEAHGAAEQGHSHDAYHGHSEFHLVVSLECANPELLGWLDLRLFEAFPGNQRMDVDVLTDTQATQARLVPGSERIRLR